MDKEKQLIFQIESPAVLQAFAADNYDIEYNNSDQTEDDLCVLYFSSNEIYYPNTIQAFDYSIIQRDKYEWKRNKLPQARKHIFIRDIRKQWYIGGINATLDSPIKLLEFLKAETSGYRIFTIGSSAGGYAAVLFGSLLNANRVYAFNAQLNLNITMKGSNSLTDPILFEKVKEDHLNTYFDLSNYFTSITDYYYFQSCGSQMDIEQYQAISLEAQKKIKIIRFRTSNHGFPFLRINLPYILAFGTNELAQFVSKTYNPIIFSIRLIGVQPTVTFVIKALTDRYKKKRLEVSLKNNFR